MEKWKLYKEKSAHLNITRPPKAEEEMELESDSDFECELRSGQGPQARGNVRCRGGAATQGPSCTSPSCSKVKAGQQGEVGGGLGPRERRRRQQAARRRDKENHMHHYWLRGKEQQRGGEGQAEEEEETV